MKATVYIDAENQLGLIAKDVEILSISEAPRITKKGKLFKQPFAGSKYMTNEEMSILILWEKGIRKADISYPDGTHEIGVWINVKDIKD